ncbi:asparagine synthase C-terminal domain-containing protein [Pseudomonas sp. RIT-PI-AD]|uniref:asparagine synthase-related protein n=1 Tax=Pseudomonas sp. RIT-PI-AD TaxID=3035294 RepID=UPI0021DB0AD7|nr:asparagine synthase C-terminal domain-containing protein [Pseudomonas sp. RIT-PI-AD]
MFSLHYSAGVIPGAWHLSGHCLSSRQGRIEALDHPKLLLRAVQTPSGRLGVALVERPHPHPAAATKDDHQLSAVDEEGFARAKARVLDWPLHGFWVEIVGRTLRIESSRLPTVPVFLARHGDEARVEWDPARLYPLLAASLDRDAAAHYLCSFEQPYGSRTLIDGLTQLTASSVALWRDGAWRLEHKAPAPADYPRLLEANADPLDSFAGLLTQGLARSLPDPSLRLAAALSGGLDSSAVVSVAARRGHPMSTFGLLMPGHEGVAQAERRAQVWDRLELHDELVEGDACDWSAHLEGPRAHLMVPWEELHYAAFDGLYQRAAAQGHSVFLTGFGGDDLLDPYWEEIPEPQRLAEMRVLQGHRPLPGFFRGELAARQVERSEALRRQPRGFVQPGVMEVAAGVAAQCLRHGLWPMHPFIEPEVVRYCHALPPEWRQGRRLMRGLLERFGYGASLTHPARTESFSPLTLRPLRQCPVFRRLLHAPRMADLGFFEPRALEKAFDDWLVGRAPQAWALHFIAVVVLEATLASLEASAGSARG